MFESSGCLCNVLIRRLSLDSISNEACTAAVCRNVSEMLAEQTAHWLGLGYWIQILPMAKHYLLCVPSQFLELVLNADGGQLQQWGKRLECFLYEYLGNMRIEKLFDMAVDYPASVPAVKDLCECLSHTTLETRLLESFRSTVSQRLLHGGASTSDIINHFNLVVRMLGDIDSSGFLLERISEPYRAYLRGRQDTMKCIVTLLTDGSNGPSMLEEFSESCARQGQPEETGEDEEMALRVAQTWEPAPMHVQPKNRRMKTSVTDVISTMVGIYGSNELFIKEYRKILADRLLTKTDFDCMAEIRIVEILTLRFGESALHNCEVMLRDMSESKRIFQGIEVSPPNARSYQRRKKTNIPKQVSATIISELFWPDLNGREINLPPDVQKQLKIYSEKFHSQKAPRQLRWKPDLGVVDLDITIGRSTLSFNNLSPVYATIIMAFQNSSTRMVNDLAREIGMSPGALHAKALFWINNGILVEGTGRNGEACYTRAEKVDKSRAGVQCQFHLFAATCVCKQLALRCNITSLPFLAARSDANSLRISSFFLEPSNVN